MKEVSVTLYYALLKHQGIRMLCERQTAPPTSTPIPKYTTSPSVQSSTGTLIQEPFHYRIPDTPFNY